MFRFVLAATLVALAGCGGEPPSDDFTGGTRSVALVPSGRELTLRTEGPAIVRGTNTFVFSPFGGQVTGASGFMPAHGHGTRPATFEALPDGTQKVGLVLYMSGRWEMSFDVRVGEATETVRLDVQVP
ncbi:MAG: hypothetical protein IPK71_31830 [Myxococcales bacterium]|jgi:hypothetical protein|nr:hypothetical protein [Myxococcales bacterium]